jgi:ABC-type lipoprotein export system ATPase subunit
MPASFLILQSPKRDIKNCQFVPAALLLRMGRVVTIENRAAQKILTANRLVKNYGGLRILREVSLSISAGERVALVGPSGCGKTTLLNCLGGIDRADAGTIFFCDDEISKLSSDALAALRRERIGTIFQFFHLLPTLTAFENVELPLQLLEVPLRERRERVIKLLERVKLSHRANAFPGQLSGGEMQRVAIARSLANRPVLLLADEPTGNLDSANGENILSLLAEVSDESQVALLMVTHSVEAARVCHRVLQMCDGAIMDETRTA